MPVVTVNGVWTNAGRDAAAAASGDQSSNWYFASYKVGEGGHQTVGGFEVPKTPDATYTALESEADADPPTGTMYTFTEALAPADLVFDGAGTKTMSISCSMGSTQGNDRGDGGNPTFYEVGVYDNNGVLCLYGTFPGTQKTAGFTLVFDLNAVF